MRLETGVGDWRKEKESGYEMRQETGRAGDRRQETMSFPPTNS